MESPQFWGDLLGLWTFNFILRIKETFSNWWLTHLRRISSGDIFIRSSRVSPGLSRFTRPGTWLIFLSFFIIILIFFLFFYLMVICLKRYILISCHTRPRTSHFLPWLWSRLSLELKSHYAFCLHLEFKVWLSIPMTTHPMAFAELMASVRFSCCCYYKQWKLKRYIWLDDWGKIYLEYS